MNNFAKRAITALGLGSLSIAFIIWSVWGLFAFCVIASVLSWSEFYRKTSDCRTLPLVILIFLGIGWWVIEAYFLINSIQTSHLILFQWMHRAVFISFFIIAVISVLLLFDKEETQPLTGVSGMIMGFWYCFIPLYLLFSMGIGNNPLSDGAWEGRPEYAFQLPLGVILLNWFLDTGAYLGGKYLGRHKLFERISPKKTWEGSIIGMATCISLCFLFLKIWPSDNWNWVIIALIISIFSQLGDLVESMFKRSLHLKDSGSLLPGHGGFLDRFDGIFLSTPLIYLYSQYSG